MPPAATDSSAEELSGIFMKKRHASQDAELRPLHDSLAHTLPGKAGLHRCTHYNCLVDAGVCATRSRNALKNANANHISITCTDVCVCVIFASGISKLACLWLLTSHFHVKSQTDTHTLTLTK